MTKRINAILYALILASFLMLAVGVAPAIAAIPAIVALTFLAGREALHPTGGRQ